MTISPLAMKTGDKGISTLCLALGERRGEGRGGHSSHSFSLRKYEPKGNIVIVSYLRRNERWDDGDIMTVLSLERGEL
jgi:hypothetical protein